MDPVEPWLTLKSVPGVGNLLFNRLISRFGSPQKVLRASAAALKGVAGIKPQVAAAISGYRTPDWIYSEIQRCRRRGIEIVTLHDSRYPALLRHIDDPPPVLYCLGSMGGDDAHIAVVGSRRATAYGKSSAQNLCCELASKSLSVVSGMARGIDTAAHLGALKGNGRTIAVLGSGLDRIYPAENLKLFHRIAEKGAVISEFALGAEPAPHHFPQRNRIISGMALGVVVVEAARRSGSLITARLAAEQGREVFAVPGSIHARTARGTHALIKQGAKLVENAEDILEEIVPHLADEATSGGATKAPSPSGKAPGSALAEFETALLDAIGPYPVHFDELLRRCEKEAGALAAALMQLELRGEIHQEPGKYFVRSAVTAGND